jgi:hypothetical protein
VLAYGAFHCSLGSFMDETAIPAPAAPFDFLGFLKRLSPFEIVEKRLVPFLVLFLDLSCYIVEALLTGLLGHHTYPSTPRLPRRRPLSGSRRYHRLPPRLSGEALHVPFLLCRIEEDGGNLLIALLLGD